MDHPSYYPTLLFPKVSSFKKFSALKTWDEVWIEILRLSKLQWLLGTEDEGPKELQTFTLKLDELEKRFT